MTKSFKSFAADAVKHPLKSQAFQGPSLQTGQVSLIPARLVGDRDSGDICIRRRFENLENGFSDGSHDMAHY